MRPDIMTFRVNDHYLIGANVGLRVVVLQPDACTVAYDVDLDADCRGHFFLSEDGGLLAAAFAYEKFCCLEVIDLRGNATILAESREKATILRIKRVYALDVRIAPDGETLLYYAHGARSGTYAAHLPSGQRQKFPKATFPTNGAWLADGAILPFSRGRGGIRVSCWPLVISPVELPIKSNVWRMIAHPSNEIVAILAKDLVASLRADTLELLWQRRIPEAAWICYSGDGRFIAVKEIEPAGGPTKRIVLLDAGVGEIVRSIETSEQARFSLDGSRFLCSSGRFLNAETGEFEDGVSDLGFWRSFDQ